MTKLKVCRGFCGGTERGELELQESKQRNDYPEREDGKRRYTCIQNVRNYFVDFCTGGTMHGIRYFSEERTCIEKIWWLLSISVSLYYCIQLVVSTYIKWETSPVIVSFATKETPAYMVPFPSVTICPQARSSPLLFNYTKYLHMKQDNIQLQPEIETKFGYLAFLCEENLNLNYTSDKFARDDIFDFYETVQPKFLENMEGCMFMGRSYNCSEIFTPIITDEGLCYSFNIIDRTTLFTDIVVHHKNFHRAPVTDDWTLEQGYSPGAPLYAYPRRTFWSGVPFALEVKLLIHKDDLDYTCRKSTGFKVQIAHPQRLPRVKQQHFVVPLDRTTKAAITPEMMSTSKAVRNYLPVRRNCFFTSEMPLKYFKVYTMNNCQVECRTNYTLQKCGCVSFYMPRDKDALVCGAGSLKCVEEAASEMLYGVIERRFAAESGNKTAKGDILNCKCFPVCTGLFYRVENSQSPWDWKIVYRHNRHKKNLSDQKIHMSMLQVFFKNSQFITSERNELYGSTDFLASVGGLFGLFIGFSALSFIEIIYYLTLRIVCNIILFGKNNWSGKAD